MKGSALWRHRLLLTSVVLMAVALHLLTTNARPGSIAGKPIAKVMLALSPALNWSNRLTAGTSGFMNNYIALSDAARENELLKARIAELRNQQNQLAELRIENQHLADLLDMADALTLPTIGADVIGGDAGGLARTIVISQGAARGVRTGMAVLSLDGVVGKVIAVSSDASRVLLINDHNSALDAFDQRSRVAGIIAGVVDDGLVMKYVVRTRDIRVGDHIVTSGLDGIFPRGLLVGTIKSISRDGPGMFLNLAVTPAADFGNLEQVLVVTQSPPHLFESTAQAGMNP